MTLFTNETTILDDVWVALHLKTTGDDPGFNEIIEIGAVKFRGERVLDTFQSFVKSNSYINDDLNLFTDIKRSDVDAAPTFSVVAGQLITFLGSAPIVGHKLGLELEFLAGKGARLSNPKIDTWDLAFVLIPDSNEYTIEKIAATLSISHSRVRRAVSYAQTIGRIFWRLVQIVNELDLDTLAQLRNVAAKSSWMSDRLMKSLELHKLQSGAQRQIVNSTDLMRDPTAKEVSVTGPGFDLAELKKRLGQDNNLRQSKVLQRVDFEQVYSVLREGGLLSRVVPGFEERSEQMIMARAVTEAINHKKRLMVEAGTGVGKSLAYLLPAAMYALLNNKRVVVSTNTINLQEQLVTKDLPILINALENALENLPNREVQKLTYCHLKGRSNYLCLKRWSHLLFGGLLSDDEAKLVSKVLIWLQSTTTGDRSELNLAGRDSQASWMRLSSDGAIECPGLEGVCFLRSARDKSASAHLIVVNHALLMSDIVSEGTLIPDYDILIVDEAHHLEEEATRHLGFELGHRSMDDYVESIAGDRGLVRQIISAIHSSSASKTRVNTFGEVAQRIISTAPAVKSKIKSMFDALVLLVELDGSIVSGLAETRITSATRSHPDWSSLEIIWETVDGALAEFRADIMTLSISLEGLQESGIANYESFTMEIQNRLQFATDMRLRLREFVPQPRANDIYWVSNLNKEESLVLHGAPLNVGEQLETTLFSQKEAVVMTSATLSSNGSFDHMRDRLGFHDCEEQLLGSPFDYPNASLLCVPVNMPMPSSSAYQHAVEKAIVDSTIGADGRTMALFTSHASLQTAASGIRSELQGLGYNVLAQGVDAPPHRLVEIFLENPKSVLLGTASFWEGVDLAGEALKVLLVAKLPFSVPTEPVFEARSEQYEDPFGDYSLPQAILRLRQGFGRLIRTKTDRGVVVILDRRIVARKYGKEFLNSLPPSSFKTCKLHELSREIKKWI